MSKVWVSVHSLCVIAREYRVFWKAEDVILHTFRFFLILSKEYSRRVKGMVFNRSEYLVIILFWVCSCMDENKDSHLDKACEELVNEVNRMNLYQRRSRKWNRKRIRTWNCEYSGVFGVARKIGWDSSNCLDRIRNRCKYSYEGIKCLILWNNIIYL